MVKWLQQVQSTLKLNPDTVWIAMSIFDRYLCSGRGGSVRALEDKCKFQLAAITAFYTAVKIHEPVVLGIDMLLVPPGKFVMGMSVGDTDANTDEKPALFQRPIIEVGK